MRTIEFDEFEANQERCFDEVSETGEPLKVLRENGSFVVLTLQEFKALGGHDRWPLPEGV